MDTRYRQHVYYCPLSTCSWTCDESEAIAAEEEPPAGPWTSAFDAFASILGTVERALKQHLETHTLLEWVSEISRLREVIDLTAISLGWGSSER